MNKLNNVKQGITTSVALRKSTKDKLDKNRAPGQCYNGFILQLVDMWEKLREEKQFSRTVSAEVGRRDKQTMIPF